MTFYIRNGNIVKLTDEKAINLSDTLQPGNYVVKFDEQNGMFYLEETDMFLPIDKYYDDIEAKVDRIHNTFRMRENSTGVMLVGEKGSGKTLLAKALSIEGYVRRIPTLLVNQPWSGDGFSKFIQDIDQQAIVIFDEFEKIYNSEKQDEVLTLFDGVYPSKKMFIVSCNDTYKVNSHMRNRPGRFYYYLTFTGLNDNFIRTYCVDNNVCEDYIDELCQFASMFNMFNFDMLKAIVEEMNRYDESPEQAIKYINASPHNDFNNSYDVIVYYNGKLIDPASSELYPIHYHDNPYNTTLNISFRIDDSNYLRYNLQCSDINRFDIETNSIVYVKDDFEIHLRRRERSNFNWKKFL